MRLSICRYRRQPIWQALTDTTFNEKKKLTHLTRRLQAMSNDINFIIRKISNAPGSPVAYPQQTD